MPCAGTPVPVQGKLASMSGPVSTLLESPLPTAPAPLCVGFSGGLDSTVLLHWLASSPAVRAAGLCAIHIHHGLQAGADDWAAHCQ